MRKFFWLLTIVSTLIVMSFPTYADLNDECYEDGIPALINAYEKFYLTGQTDKWDLELNNFLSDEIGGPAYLFICDCVEDFKKGNNKLIKLSYEIQSFGWRDPEKVKKFSDYNFDFYYNVFTKDNKVKKMKFSLENRLVYTINEIITVLDIIDLNNIGLVSVSWNSSMGYNKITNYEVFDCIPGWNIIDNDRYYLRKDGTLATEPCLINNVFYIFDKSAICKGAYSGWAKSAGNKVYYKDGLKVTKNTTINGVRWKFDKNGICQGKYSGFVRSSKGRRYYNNGVMLRNQKFTLNGKKYVADSKGWVTEI